MNAPGSQLPLVSIVTPSFNQVGFLEETIDSVRQQTYPRIEHIVVDGGSTDGSLQLLEKQGDSIVWTSERDGGQAEAINKGFRMATGNIFGWLNADDLYLPDAVAAVADYFWKRPHAQLVYGDALAIDERGRPYGRRMNVKPGSLRELVHETDFIVQPAAFWRAELWRRVGALREDLEFTMDYDFWIRACQQTSLHHIADCLAKERIHANTKSSLGEMERIEELKALAMSHGASGIPSGFRPEAAALYCQRGLSHLVDGRFRDGIASLSAGVRLSNSLSKTGLYLATSVLLGSKSVPKARLISNWLRSVVRGVVVRPGSHEPH